MTPRAKSLAVAAVAFAAALAAFQIPPSGSWLVAVPIAAVVGALSGVVARTQVVDGEDPS